jgi:translation initiation factor IF-2
MAPCGTGRGDGRGAGTGANPPLPGPPEGARHRRLRPPRGACEGLPPGRLHRRGDPGRPGRARSRRPDAAPRRAPGDVRAAPPELPPPGGTGRGADAPGVPGGERGAADDAGAGHGAHGLDGGPGPRPHPEPGGGVRDGERGLRSRAGWEAPGRHRAPAPRDGGPRPDDRGPGAGARDRAPGHRRPGGGRAGHGALRPAGPPRGGQWRGAPRDRALRRRPRRDRGGGDRGLPQDGPHRAHEEVAPGCGGGGALAGPGGVAHGPRVHEHPFRGGDRVLRGHARGHDFAGLLPPPPHRRRGERRVPVRDADGAGPGHR